MTRYNVFCLISARRERDKRENTRFPSERYTTKRTNYYYYYNMWEQYCCVIATSFCVLRVFHYSNDTRGSCRGWYNVLWIRFYRRIKSKRLFHATTIRTGLRRTTPYFRFRFERVLEFHTALFQILIRTLRSKLQKCLLLSSASSSFASEIYTEQSF